MVMTFTKELVQEVVGHQPQVDFTQTQNLLKEQVQKVVLYLKEAKPIKLEK